MNKLRPMTDIDIWVPVIYIYSDYFDIEELMLAFYSQEKSGGAKLPEWAKKKSKSKSKSKSSSSSAFDPRSDSSDLGEYVESKNLLNLLNQMNLLNMMNFH